ncbi:MAG: hypothetical protein GEU28_15055, partial [Dehalococcoidia bacterium]|nr:hypothetical protein [Dehalococcoidia bacterium]
MILKQATAVDVLIGPFVDLADGATAEEGESPSVLLSKNGQGLAAKSDATTPAHDDAGYYNCELDATDTGTVGTLVLVVEATANALPVRHEFQVVEEAVYDQLFGASAPGAATVAALATVDQVVDDILVDTAVIGAAGAGLTEAGGTGDQLTAVPWNAAWDEQVQSEVEDGLAAYDPPTKAELDAGLAGLNDPTAAAIADAVWDEDLGDHDNADS